MTPAGLNRSALTGFLIGSLSAFALTATVRRCRSKRADTAGTRGVSSDSKRELPVDLRDEQLSRHTLYFGEEGMGKLKSASVAVVGLGGVGSHTAHMLARAGISHLRLIDFDQVTLSTLNRHACATLDDVGTPKATCLRRFLEKICPDPSFLKIEDVVQMYTVEGGPDLLAGRKWDLVLDCIDDTPTKAALVAYCVEQGIRVVSCMGAGGKSDVTRLHISDLRAASRDPLASKLRQCLKRGLRHTNTDISFIDDMDQLAVVFSSEKPVVKLADFTDAQKASGVHKYGAVDGMRIRILPVLGTMPAIMGQAIAAFALCELGQKPISGSPSLENASAEMSVIGCPVPRPIRYDRLYQIFKQREQRIAAQVLAGSGDILECDSSRLVDNTWVGSPLIDTDDVEYILEVWRNRCAVTGDRLGAVLEIVRWDLSRPSYCNNLVLMGKKALAKFNAEGRASVADRMRKKIEHRLASCKLDVYS